MRKTLIATCMLTAFATCTLAQPQTASAQDIPRVVAAARGAVVLLKTFDRDGVLVGLGSGFRIAGGRFVTNAHVIAGASRVEVFNDSGALLGVARSADMLSTSVDLAILPSAGPRAPYLSLAGASPAIGEHVIVIGAPEGLTNTVSDGIVSARRKIGARHLLQISAPISPGSSGGPVLNNKGQVVGVSESILREGQNLNFAVPVSEVIALASSRAGQFEFPAATEKVARSPTQRGGFSGAAGGSSAPVLTLGSYLHGDLASGDEIVEGNYADYYRINEDKALSVSIWVSSPDFTPSFRVFKVVGDTLVAVAASKPVYGEKQVTPLRLESARMALSLLPHVAYVMIVNATDDSHSKAGGYGLSVGAANGMMPAGSRLVKIEERWLESGSTDIFDIHFDRTRIERSTDNAYLVWTRLTYRGPNTGKDGQAFDVTMEQDEISCADGRFRVLSVARFLKGDVVASSFSPTEWLTVFPESVGELSQRTICAYINAHGF